MLGFSEDGCEKIPGTQYQFVVDSPIAISSQLFVARLSIGDCPAAPAAPFTNRGRSGVFCQLPEKKGASR